MAYLIDSRADTVDSKPGFRSGATFLFVLALLILSAAAFRLYRIEKQSIWFDEGWSAFAAEQPTLADAFNADATNPPLYYGLLHIAARFLGTTEFGLRVFSLLVGLPVIPLTYQLARRTSGRRAGILAAALVAFSAPLWWASQEARMYTLLALLVVISALAWEQLRRQPTRAAWVALWLSELAMLYAHNTGPIIVLWLNAAMVALWATRIIQQERPRPSLTGWIAGQVGVGLLYLPYFVSRFLRLAAANSAVQSAPSVSLETAWRVWQGLWTAPWSLVISQQLPIMVLCLLLLVISPLAFRKPARWLVIHSLILTAALIVGLIVLGNDLHGRYLVMIVPLVAAAVAVGLSSLSSALRGIGLLAAITLFFVSIAAGQNPDYEHDDVRGMVQYYADHLTADDTVLAWSYADRYDLAYYWDRLGVKARRVTLPEGADLETIAPLVPSMGRVALNIWYTQRADYRGMMGCILAHGAETPPEQFTTYGMTNLLYADPPLSLPRMHDFSVTYSVYGLGSEITLERTGDIPEFASDAALCVPLQFFSPLGIGGEAGDLKVALIAHNALGWEIARTDAIIATDDQRTTTQFPSTGFSGAAFPLLRLPEGTPGGEYPLFLRLYDETHQPSGYAPSAADQPIVGRDVQIGIWHASDGEWVAPEIAPAGVTPTVMDISTSESGILRNGDALRLTLAWTGSGQSQSVTLRDAQGAWSVTSSVQPRMIRGVLREWHELVVPADAPSGEAILSAGSRQISVYRVEPLPMETEPPTDLSAINVDFPGIGTLVGARLPDQPLHIGEKPEVTLVWKAGDSPSSISYTVFVQLLDDGGEVIAQSDSIPAANTHPTTGWRAGEYITDSHALTFNDRAAPGRGRLIVGLYDRLTGTRVKLADGTDFAVIGEGIEVR